MKLTEKSNTWSRMNKIKCVMVLGAVIIIGCHIVYYLKIFLDLKKQKDELTVKINKPVHPQTLSVEELLAVLKESFDKATDYKRTIDFTFTEENDGNPSIGYEAQTVSRLSDWNIKGCDQYTYGHPNNVGIEVVQLGLGVNSKKLKVPKTVVNTFIDHDAKMFTYFLTGPRAIVKDTIENPYHIWNTYKVYPGLKKQLPSQWYIKGLVHHSALAVHLFTKAKIFDTSMKFHKNIIEKWAQKNFAYQDQLKIERDALTPKLNEMKKMVWKCLIAMALLFVCVYIQRIYKKIVEECAHFRNFVKQFGIRRQKKQQKQMQKEAQEQKRQIREKHSREKKEEKQRLKLQIDAHEKARNEKRKLQISECIENAFQDSSALGQILRGIDGWPDTRQKEFYELLNQNFALPMTAEEEAAYEEEQVMYKAMGRHEESIHKKLSIYSTIDELQQKIREIRDTKTQEKLKNKLNSFEQIVKKEWL